MRATIVPDPAAAIPVRMIHAPIATMVVGGHDIDRGDGKRGQIPTPLPFQDHEGVRPRLAQSIQPIEGKHPEPSPWRGQVLLTPTSEIVLELRVGMEFLAVVRRVWFKRQPMHCLSLTIDPGLGLLG